MAFHRALGGFGKAGVDVRGRARQRRPGGAQRGNGQLNEWWLVLRVEVARLDERPRIELASDIGRSVEQEIQPDRPIVLGVRVEQVGVRAAGRQGAGDHGPTQPVPTQSSEKGVSVTRREHLAPTLERGVCIGRDFDLVIVHRVHRVHRTRRERGDSLINRGRAEQDCAPLVDREGSHMRRGS